MPGMTTMSFHVYSTWECFRCKAAGVFGGESVLGVKWAECMTCGAELGWVAAQEHQNQLRTGYMFRQPPLMRAESSPG